MLDNINLFESINLIYIITVIFFISKYFKIENKYIFIIFSHLVLIFFLNGFLFDPSYMPDQFRYLLISQNLRDFDFFLDENFKWGAPTFLASLIFALFPIPFIDSLFSLSLINFMFFFLFFCFLYLNNYFNNKYTLYFCLFFPSLALYSSLALRDMMIFLVMFYLFYFFIIKKNLFISFIFMILLGILKFQNLLIFSLIIPLYILLSTLPKYYKVIMSFLFILVLFIFQDYFSLDKLNSVRLMFYKENFEDMSQYYAFKNHLDIVLNSISSGIYFIFRPLASFSDEPLIIVQFLENILVNTIILYIVFINIKNKLYLNKEVFILNCYFLLFIVVYGLVIFNSGTAVRYKFPMISLFIIFSIYFINKKGIKHS